MVWLSERQACAYLAISRSSLYRMRKNGEIPFAKVGRLLRYAMHDLNQYLLQKQVHALPSPISGSASSAHVYQHRFVNKNKMK